MLAGTVPDLGHRYWGVSPGNRAVGVLFRQIVAKRSITMLFSVWDYSVLTIEIFSDVICPWCYIGKRRLDQVLNSPTGEGVEVRWRPFQLYPSVPSQGWDRAEFIRRRYGVDADPGRVPTRIDEEAKQAGLVFNYRAIRRLPSTLLAHRLLEFAVPQGLQHALAEVLFAGYFCHGEDVGDLATLIRLAEQVGIVGDDVASALADGFAEEEVAAQLRRATDVGVSGVPGYLMGGGFLLPGAQSVDTMQQIIARAKVRLGKPD